MADIWFISDTHYGHEATCTKFKRNDGVTPLRPFSCAEEMDEVMVERWNAVVKPQDKVYHLGDVVMNRKFLPILGRLNGHKRLVRGNHDIFDDSEYHPYFEAIYGVRVFTDKFVCTHVPVHPDCITPRWNINVHGHLHANKVQKFVGRGNGNCPLEYAPKAEREAFEESQAQTPGLRFASDYDLDPRYVSVCVEHTNYAPIHMDEVMQRAELGRNAI